MDKIKQIDKEFYKKILDDYSILGLYYFKEGNVFIGVDNSTGDCWVEEFDSLEKCINWLNGEDDI